MIEEERLREMFELSRSWLLEVGAPDAGDRAACLDDLFKVLLGLWICEHAPRRTEEEPALHDLAHKIEKELLREDESGSFDPFEHDAKLLLLVHRILSEQGCRAYGLQRFARLIYAALRNLSTIPPRYVGEALLLSTLGHGKRPPASTLPTDGVYGDALQLLRADEEKLRAICRTISAATHFGSRPLSATTEVSDRLQRILPTVLAQTFRDYELDLGALLLRNLSYLRPLRKQDIRSASQFLSDQQQSDGRFGYLADESQKLYEMQGNGNFDAAKDLYLPTTVSCLWTLAETLPLGFNLISRPR